MQSKELSNVVVVIKDEANLINHGELVKVSLNINKAEDHLIIEKAPPKKVERDRSINLKCTENGASLSYQQKAKKIHIWWYMTSDTLKAPVSELRNELLAVFDQAIEKLEEIDI